MSDISSLMQAIEEDCAALDNASKVLSEFSELDTLAQAELAYEDALDAALIEVENEYRDRCEKLPSERQREARARQKISKSTREQFVEVKRKIELIEKWGRMREKALSGRQSELSFLKSEGQAPTSQQPQWSRSVA